MNSQELNWFKSSYSGGEGGECLELATCPHTIHIRDSKNPEDRSPTLHLTPSAWTAFLSGVSK